MNSDFNDELKILTTLKKWGVLSEKRISDLSKLSHRRCILSLDRLEQDRLVKLVENKESAKTYRITGSGLDHVDNVGKREHR
jgi:RIO-like serine/threonine protein kinase